MLWSDYNDRGMIKSIIKPCRPYWISLRPTFIWSPHNAQKWFLIPLKLFHENFSFIYRNWIFVNLKNIDWKNIVYMQVYYKYDAVKSILNVRFLNCRVLFCLQNAVYNFFSKTNIFFGRIMLINCMKFKIKVKILHIV